MTTVASPALVILAEVFVPGHPKTKGSMEHIGGGKMRESVANSGRWRKLVAQQVKADFVLREPQRHFNMGLEGGVSWPMDLPYAGRVGVRVVSHVQAATGHEDWFERAKKWLMTKFSGDVDKYARNVLDALTDSGIIADDSQVWDLFSSKRLAGPGAMPGQTIQVWIIPESMPW